MDVSVNYVAILLAAISSMVIGFAWYSPYLFGKQWMKLSGYTSTNMKKEQKEMGKRYGLSFVLGLITAYVLFHVMTLSMNYFNYAPIVTGLTSGLWMWLGFIMPTQATGTIFGDKKWQLFSINTGYQLVVVLVMGVILGVMI